MNSFDSDNSSGGDDSGAEEYEMSGQALNDFEKSEIRFVHLKLRTRKSIVKDYVQLRKYLIKKGVTMSLLDKAITSKDKDAIKEFYKKSKGELEGGNDELLFSPASTMTTANGKMRKAQAL